MPVEFDFRNSGAAKSDNVTVPGSVTNTDTDDLVGSQSVTFSVSTSSLDGTEEIIFRNNDVADHGLFLNDEGANDIWTLNFQDTAVPGNNALTGNIQLEIGDREGMIFVEFLTAGGASVKTTFLSSGTGNMTLSTTSATPVTGIRFSAVGGVTNDSVELIRLSADGLNCYLENTLIATPNGQVPVEKLNAGDMILTTDGRTVEVKWLGYQHIDTRVTHPAKVNPICIRAGALAEGVPSRDLYLSPDHAVELDGMLINAGALVNGETIFQLREMPKDGFTYYHIETEAHELLVAEGCAAESFVDVSGVFTFDNRAERVARQVPEMPLPRVSSARMVPETTRARLLRRAKAQSGLGIAV